MRLGNPNVSEVIFGIMIWSASSLFEECTVTNSTKTRLWTDWIHEKLCGVIGAEKELRKEIDSIQFVFDLKP